MASSVNRNMTIAKQTHYQPGGEICETARLPDGRVLRVVGFEHYRSVTAELRAWLAFLGLAAMLFGCGGAVFSPGVEDPVDSSPAEASAPADSGSRGEGAASTDGGEMEATTDARCDRCSCLPDGAAGCANPPLDAAGCSSISALCGAQASAPAQFIIDFGVSPGVCVYAHHTHPLVVQTPAACAACGAYTCECLQANGACDQPAADQGPTSLWEGCHVDSSDILIVTCQ